MKQRAPNAEMRSVRGLLARNDAIEHRPLNTELGMKTHLRQQMVPRRQNGKLGKNEITELPPPVLQTTSRVINTGIEVHPRPIDPMIVRQLVGDLFHLIGHIRP